MNTISITIRCPGCGGAMGPLVMGCGACGVEVKGRFSVNEFAGLSAEDLHFLRIFVHCEGRIREMESALGVSYPTIKGRLAKLKETLGAGGVVEGAATGEAVGEDAAAGVLRELEAGLIGFEEAMQRIKDLREGERR